MAFDWRRGVAITNNIVTSESEKSLGGDNTDCVNFRDAEVLFWTFYKCAKRNEASIQLFDIGVARYRS